MGLKANGQNGAKAQLRLKCEKAFRVFDSLLDARKATGSSRSQTVCLLDMNVILMSIPESVTTLAGCVSVVWSFLECALGTGWLTILVFDEPNAMTSAKKAEQARRDELRDSKKVLCSEDLDPLDVPLNFTGEDLEIMASVLPLRDHRPTRSRLYDEISRRVYNIASAKADKWNATGNPEHHTVVILDGVDPRGCKRAADGARFPVLHGNDDAIVAAFQRQTPIGEGDIKLQQLDGRIRELAADDGLLAGTNLVLSSTIDTDSLMIACLNAAKRRVNPSATQVNSVLCMRTPATKAQKAENANAKATYLVCEIALLEASIQNIVWGPSATPTPTEMLNTMIALSACAALSGCDFVTLQGARFDHFFDSLGEFVKTEPSALQEFSAVLAPDAPSAKRSCHALLRVCYTASKQMEEKGGRYKKQALSVQNVDDETLRRAVWTSAYWCENEHHAGEEWGFQPLFCF